MIFTEEDLQIIKSYRRKGVISGSIVYLSKSDSKLEQFTKRNKITISAPQFHIDL